LKLARCFRRLETELRQGNNVKRLKGEWSGYRRYRVGDWRVIYRVEDASNRVNVLVIAHRREVYE
jgi:mRNA interferase RelE/StbE